MILDYVVERVSKNYYLWRIWRGRCDAGEPCFIQHDGCIYIFSNKQLFFIRFLFWRVLAFDQEMMSRGDKGREGARKIWRRRALSLLHLHVGIKLSSSFLPSFSFMYYRSSIIITVAVSLVVVFIIVSFD